MSDEHAPAFTQQQARNLLALLQPQIQQARALAEILAVIQPIAEGPPPLDVPPE